MLLHLQACLAALLSATTVKLLVVKASLSTPDTLLQQFSLNPINCVQVTEKLTHKDIKTRPNLGVDVESLLKTQIGSLCLRLIEKVYHFVLRITCKVNETLGESRRKFDRLLARVEKFSINFNNDFLCAENRNSKLLLFRAPHLVCFISKQRGTFNRAIITKESRQNESN